MTTRPGFIWSGTEWVAIGQEAVVAPISYQTSAPSSPSTGDIWIDSNDDVPGIDTSQFLRWRKTVAGGETSVSGTDDTGLTLAYTAGYEQVYLNGVLLVRGQDYTATTGTSITGLTALAASDVVEVFGVVARVVGDVYTQAQADGKYSLQTTTGLVLLNTTAFTTSSTISVDNIFTSSYDNYRITLNISALSGTDVAINWYGRTGGSDVTTNYSSQQFRFYGSTTNAASFSGAVIGAGSSTYATYSQSEMTLFNPQKAQVTTWHGTYTNMDSSATNLKYLMYGNHTSTNQFDGIKIYPASGTMTGTLRIYGMK